MNFSSSFFEKMHDTFEDVLIHLNMNSWKDLLTTSAVIAAEIALVLTAVRNILP